MITHCHLSEDGVALDGEMVDIPRLLQDAADSNSVRMAWIRVRSFSVLRTYPIAVLELDQVRYPAEGAVVVRTPGHDPVVVRERQAVVVSTGYIDDVLLIANSIISPRRLSDGEDSLTGSQAQLPFLVGPHDEDVHGLPGGPVDDFMSLSLRSLSHLDLDGECISFTRV